MSEVPSRAENRGRGRGRGRGRARRGRGFAGFRPAFDSTRGRNDDPMFHDLDYMVEDDMKDEDLEFLPKRGRMESPTSSAGPDRSSRFQKSESKQQKNHNANEKKAGMGWLNQLLNDVAGDKIQQVEKLLTPEKIQSLLADLKSIKIDGYGPFDSVLHQHGNVLRARNNAEHRNPLIAAVLYGAMKCLKFFVERVHIPIDSTGSIEAPGLMLAAALGHVDIFKYLVDNGSNIMMQGSDGSNVLHIAAKYGHKEILELAIAKGADLKAVDKFGMTALRYASLERNFACVRLFLANMKEVTDEASFHPIFEALKLMLDRAMSKNKKKKKDENNDIDSNSVRSIILDTAFKMPIPTIAFESIKDPEAEDLILERLFQESSRSSRFVIKELKQWPHDIVSPEGLSNFIAGSARFLKKKKAVLDFSVDDFEFLLKILMSSCSSSTIEAFGALFYQPQNSSWITFPILNVFTRMIHWSLKVLIFGIQPYFENCISFVSSVGKVYLRTVLASEVSLENSEFKILESVWNYLEDAINCFAEFVSDSERYAACIYFFFLWNQVFFPKNSEKNRSLHHLEFNADISEKTSEFLKKHRNALIYIIEDQSVNLQKYFSFIPRLSGILDISIRAMVFSEISQSIESSEEFDGAEHVIVLNRMSGEEPNIGVLVEQVLAVPAKAMRAQLSVEFLEERGIGDGPIREGIFYLSEHIRKEGILIPSPSSEVYVLKKSAQYPPNYFECFGRICALAIIKQIPLGVPLSRCLLKFVSKFENFSVEDIKDFDKGVYNSLKYISENNIESLDEMHFVIDEEGKECPLIPNGGSVQVTNANKSQYIQKYVAARCLGVGYQTDPNLAAFVQGFQDVIGGPRRAQMLSTEDLFTLINGQTNINVEELRIRTEWSGFQPEQEQLLSKWFWEMFEELSIEDQKKLLHFWSGSTFAPISLEKNSKYSENEKWQIERLVTSSASLPNCSTCTRTLRIPLYSSKQELVHKFTQAIQFASLGYDKE